MVTLAIAPKMKFIAILALAVTLSLCYVAYRIVRRFRE